MLIPVFVSCPTDLNAEQSSAQIFIYRELGKLGLQARTVGKTDYPASTPLLEVLQLARHCSGGLVLGFTQFESKGGMWKRDTPREKAVKAADRVNFPTPWNQLETGILFALGLPQLVFREEGVVGGVFDPGAMDVFVHRMPTGTLKAQEKRAVREVLRKWSGKVQARYYETPSR